MTQPAMPATIPSVPHDAILCATGFTCWGIVTERGAICPECKELRDAGDPEWWADQQVYPSRSTPPTIPGETDTHGTLTLS